MSVVLQVNPVCVIQVVQECTGFYLGFWGRLCCNRSVERVFDLLLKLLPVIAKQFLVSCPLNQADYVHVKVLKFTLHNGVQHHMCDQLLGQYAMP